MPENEATTCSTRDALQDMQETASRRLAKALSLARQAHGNAAEEAVERAKEAVASLANRLAAHRNLHHC
jgi:cysteine sulfinate desulfinase/cysteine desulfurase-like protein